MKRKVLPLILPVVALLLLVSTVYGGDVSTTTKQVPILVLSSASAIVTQEVGAVDINVNSQYVDSYITANAFNMEFHEVSTDIPYMPGTLNTDIRYAFNNVPTEETAAATNDTANDITLPTAVGEYTYFAFDHRAKNLVLNISQASVGDGDIVWQYYDHDTTTWNTFPSYVDNTVGFQVAGTNSIVWDIPSSGWNRGTLFTSGSDEGVDQFTGFWVRAWMVSGTWTGDPAGAQVWYSTGQVFYYVDSIAPTDQLNYDLYMGGTTPIRTYHNYFPGFDGIQTNDDSDLEFNGNWELNFKSALKVDSSEIGNLFTKPSSAQLVYASSATVGGNNLITFNTTGTDFFGEWTHNEEGTSGYYSGGGIESYSQALYNAASNYATSHGEDSADLVSNFGPGDEVTTNKVGQAYDKAIDTTTSFGDKIADPS